MRKQLLSLASLLALAACDSSLDKDAKTGGFDNFPGQGVMTEGPVPGSAEDFHKNITDTVHFDFDKYAVRSGDAAILDKQAEWLKKWPSVHAVVEGHCDIRGTVEYNLGLGERRANAVKNYLVAHGIEADRLEVVSYGKEHPISAGKTDADHAMDRRAHTVIR